jgi:Cu2+-containing amine oxidase
MGTPTSFCGMHLSGATPAGEDFSSSGCLATEFNRVPRGFFDRNPSIDLPPSKRKPGSCEARV